MPRLAAPCRRARVVTDRRGVGGGEIKCLLPPLKVKRKCLFLSEVRKVFELELSASYFFIVFVFAAIPVVNIFSYF